MVSTGICGIPGTGSNPVRHPEIFLVYWYCKVYLDNLTVRTQEGVGKPKVSRGGNTKTAWF